MAPEQKTALLIIVVCLLMAGVLYTQGPALAQNADVLASGRIMNLTASGDDPVCSSTFDTTMNFMAEAKFVGKSSVSGTVTLQYAAAVDGTFSNVTDAVDLALTADVLFVLNDDRGLRRYRVCFNPSATPHTTWFDAHGGGGGR